MKYVSVHHGSVTNLKRMPPSSRGNPRWSFDFDGYRVVTAPNSSIAFQLERWAGVDAIAYLGTLRGKLTLSSIHANKKAV